MMKRGICSLVLCIVIGVTLLVPVKMVFAAEFNLRLAHISDENHPSHKGSLLFKQLVEERTDGKVEIQIFPNSALGSAPEYTEQMRLGIVDLGLSTSGQLQVWVKEYAAVMIPFLFESYQHAHNALDGEAGDLLASLAEKEDLVVLSNWEWGFRQITNNKKPIKGPKDLEKMKMRVPNEIQLQSMYETLKSVTTVVAFPELYMALSQGVVDGQCNPIPTIYHHKFFEVQKYLAISNHVYNTQMLVASKKKWDSLPENIQKILTECSEVAGLYVRQLTMSSEEELVKEMEDKGMIVTRPDLSAFAKAVKPAVDKVAEFAGKDFTMKFVESVQNAK